MTRPSRMQGRSKLDMIPLLTVVFGTGIAAWALFGTIATTEAMISTSAVHPHKRDAEAAVVAVPLGTARAPSVITAHDVESMLVRTLLEVRENRMEAAMKQIDS